MDEEPVSPPNDVFEPYQNEHSQQFLEKLEKHKDVCLTFEPGQKVRVVSLLKNHQKRIFSMDEEPVSRPNDSF